MFSQGQLIFGLCFFIAFVIAMVFAYKKDLALHKVFYKGNYKVLIAFLMFIAILFVIKIFFKR
jgi:short subunit fatty acids transporter